MARPLPSTQSGTPVNLAAVTPELEPQAAAAEYLDAKADALTDGIEDLAEFVAKARRAEARALRDAAQELRVLAGQVEAHPPLHQWRVEILDGDQWMPAGALHRDRVKAQGLLEAGSESRPLWSDGTPVQRRLVRETTTYTTYTTVIPEEPTP